MRGHMENRQYPGRPISVGPDYPLDLAWSVRNYIVLILGQVPPEDSETYRKFQEVITILENKLDMIE